MTTLRILEPAPGVFAYYDGRIPGRAPRPFTPDNWFDDAFELGTASYAIVEGTQALVYDTHLSTTHARAIRAHLREHGVTAIRVALSHWHADHVAGNAVFSDCAILALGLTAAALARHDTGLARGAPPIDPLVMPSHLFDGRLDLAIGGRAVELHHVDVHSADGLVVWLPDAGLLLAGDTLEDTIPYIAEPDRTAIHIRALDRLRTWPIKRVLPNHGDAARIAAGGYDPRLLDANRDYLARLSSLSGDRPATGETLSSFIAADIASGAVTYCAAYERVHRGNVAALEQAPQ